LPEKNTSKNKGSIKGGDSLAPAAYNGGQGGRTPTTRTYPTADPIERAYLVAVELKGKPARFSSQSSLDELTLLAETAGARVVGRTVQKLESPHSATYVGKGKLSEIKAERPGLDYSLVIFDDELTPSQQRSLEDALKVKVLDRTALILDIFARRAQTREGRLQVDLAQHEYLLPRLAGQWSHLEHLEGAIGTRGPGETQLETDRRLAREQIARLKRQIEAVRRQRALYRRRRARAGVPVVALVGYTNAGKSTLMRALSGADAFTEDKLFATLDPLTRRVSLPGRRTILLSDTVGFIQKLPAQLVAAFRATLEELSAADILVHVVDITHPDAPQQSQTVQDTLAELGLADKPVITVLNKVDLLSRDGRPIEGLEELREHSRSLAYDRPDAALISAEKGWGLEELLDRIGTVLDEGIEALAAPRSRWANRQAHPAP
jgi:GTP-binding protein HflX